MRLDRFVCKSSNLSRAQAHQAITTGRVCVNSLTITDVTLQVHENNHITLDEEPLVLRPFRYLMLYKPANTVCSNIDEAYPSVFSSLSTHTPIDRPDHLHIAGRLDADTTGLVLATDDGRWSFNIIRPDQHCEKTYRVHLSRPLADDASARFAAGIQLQGEAGLTRPARLEILAPQEVRLSITEGKYHQVKRMFAAVGNRVLQLHRERIGVIELDIEIGQWRNLREDEVQPFQSASEV